MTNHRHKTKTPARPRFQSPLVDEWPPPYRYLTYPGYHLNQVGQSRGPAYFPSLRGGQANDQMLTVVSEEYDTLTDSTRHGLVYGIVMKRKVNA